MPVVRGKSGVKICGALAPAAKVPQNRVSDACAGVSVAIGVDRMCHGCIGLRLFQKLSGQADDLIVLWSVLAGAAIAAAALILILKKKQRSGEE